MNLCFFFTAILKRHASTSHNSRALEVKNPFIYTDIDLNDIA